MANQSRLLELALRGLEAERQRIEDEISDIRRQMKGNGTGPSSGGSPSKTRKSGRLSAAGRRAISEAMKRRWAERRKALK